MTLDDGILREAKAAREALLELERQEEHARVDYHHAIRRLHAAGGSLREIADALGLSHQRVHQIVGEQEPFAMHFPVRGPDVEREVRRFRRGGPRKRGFFTRFSEPARDVVVRAQDEARTFKHNYIGTEHIILGLLRDEDSVAARALAILGITIERMREEVVRVVGVGDVEPVGHIPFTKRTKKSLELALREALALGQDFIGTEHVLLGVVADEDCVGAQVLAALGGDAEAVRAAVADQLAA